MGSTKPINNVAIGMGEDDFTLEDRLRQLVESIAAMAQQANINLVAHRPGSWIYYRSLPKARKQEILDSCQIFHQICVNTLEEGRPISDTKALLWSSLKYFGMAPCSDLMDFVSDELTVELYDSEGRQVFRNFKFMEVCSYTLADVLLYPWWELFARNDEIVAGLLKEAAHILSGQTNSTLISENPFHRTDEIFSERRHELRMRVKYLSPVFARQGRKIAGFICISEVHLIGVHTGQSTDRPQLRVVEARERTN